MKAEKYMLKGSYKMKKILALITAAVLSIGGLVLLFCGAFIAPQGEIHESLLVGFGRSVRGLYR